MTRESEVCAKTQFSYVEFRDLQTHTNTKTKLMKEQTLGALIGRLELPIYGSYIAVKKRQPAPHCLGGDSWPARKSHVSKRRDVVCRHSITVLVKRQAAAAAEEALASFVRIEVH